MNQNKDIKSIKGDMHGKTCLVTGANSGLGKAVSIELARRGASIIMACRKEYIEARDEIRKQAHADKVSLRLLDLADLASVNRFCDGLRDDGIQLDVIHLNAGMAAVSQEMSIDGFPLFWQVNYFSNTLLIKRMLADGVIPVVNSSGLEINQVVVPRIIFTSSSRHRGSLSINFSNFAVFPAFSIKDTFKYYGLSKLYLMTYAWQLGRRLQENGLPRVSVFAFCPGAFRSHIGEDLGFVGNLVMSTRPTGPVEASWPALYLACSEDLKGKTLLYYHKHELELPDARVFDSEIGNRLWQETELLLENTSD